MFQRGCILAAGLFVATIGFSGESRATGDRPAKEPVESRTSLFNGRDLSGWEPVGKGAVGDWSVEGGVIVCHGKGHTWLRTRKEYGDFTLRLEYEIAPGANSGVYVRVPANGNHHRADASAPPAGFEVQILDDAAPKYAGLKDYQFTASIYDIAGASTHVGKPPGQWNTLEIRCKGEHVAIVHNGVRVVDAGVDRYPLLKLRSSQGYLGLQSHNGVVRFRNISIAPPARRAASPSVSAAESRSLSRVGGSSASGGESKQTDPPHTPAAPNR